MAKGTTTATQWLKLVFHSESPLSLTPWLGDPLYLALHTANPTASGSQNTNEANYTGYARVLVPVDTITWSIPSNSATTLVDIEFPQCTGGSNTITYASLGTDATGAGQIIYVGALSASAAVSVGITPRFLAGDLVVTEA